MSLYQCEHCGCCENTALGMQPKTPTQWFRWDASLGNLDLEGKHLCSACGPKFYRDGTLTGMGQWHGQFKRVFLPMGKFKTNSIGNLEHIETGSEDFRAYALDAAQAAEERKS
ncbi:hypothetical protein OYT13_14040 [Pandoraea sp. XJJ-1]|uniref:hypothetical protein n=1 Tax=Pandoraea sp. XJJ-1 TaxID=3002643 RepID=UPI00227FF618|nr:hypothetical protein [Pandoraea sp. XJJ-1]WAL80995.1 hypothetical protein OYT13_14040 [Pandoraea sp. XJJ-1]